MRLLGKNVYQCVFKAKISLINAFLNFYVKKIEDSHAVVKSNTETFFVHFTQLFPTPCQPKLYPSWGINFRADFPDQLVRISVYLFNPIHSITSHLCRCPPQSNTNEYYF